MAAGDDEPIVNEENEERIQLSIRQSKIELKTYRRIIKHTQFVTWAVFSELGLAEYRSKDFWIIMMLLAIMWFVRLYLHYCSQWLFLQSISVPVTKFQLHAHTVELRYQASLLYTREELGMVVVGPLSLNAVMLLLVLIRWCCQLVYVSSLSFMSKMIIAMGVWTVLDPLAVFLVDVLLGRLAYSEENPVADAAKLYWLFFRTEQTGLPGVVITALLYTLIFIISFSVLYFYLLRLHKESWLLDALQRISGNENEFCIPLDMEISNQELSFVVKKAEQWRGLNGERRKVKIEYIFNIFMAKTQPAPPSPEMYCPAAESEGPSWSQDGKCCSHADLELV
ncbi:uncharacterized protein [Pleurodeles waltl]|uniref:uncharacterized protein n=1 Tax=Pleurodeles waltl TaxID=8319 RepID=UPI0037099F67